MALEKQKFLVYHSARQSEFLKFPMLGFKIAHASVLDLFQSGFCPSHGAETLLVSLTDNFWRQLDHGGSVLLLLLDLTAVFDRVDVDYDLLNHCFIDPGIQGSFLQWVSSFLHSQG